MILPTPPGISSSLTSVRWLGERCGVAGASTPLPRLASQMLLEPDCAAATQAYVTWWLRHPDQGSTFEAKTSGLRELPDADSISTLQRLGYDGFIYQCGEDIVGHVFFQKSGTDLSAFSASVAKAYRGGRWWATFSLDFVAYAALVSGVRRASVGTGKNLVARLLLKLIRPHAAQLGWRASDDGWIEFDRGGED